MNCLLLCAGYGTRFLAGLESSPEFKHLRGIPKPLLPMAGGKELLTHWVELLLVAKDGTGADIDAKESTGPLLGSICVVTNELFLEQFKTWAQKWEFTGSFFF